jgi:YggT family protein
MVLYGFLWIYKFVLIARAITSWVSANPRNSIVVFLYMVTEPAIRVIRRRLPSSLRYFPLDIAFLVLFALVLFAEYGIVPLMLDYAAQMRHSALSAPAEIY